MSASSKVVSRSRMGSLLVLLLAAMSSLFFVVQASPAAGVASQSAVGVRAAAPYPPVLCPTIAVSTTHPFPGETITVTGQGFDAAQSLTLVLTPGNHLLAHVTTSASGAFSTQVTLPSGVTGNSVIRVEGSSSDCPVDSIAINISSSSTHPSGSPLPFTGVDILTALAIALALVGAGLLLARSGRRSTRGAHGRR